MDFSYTGYVPVVDPPWTWTRTSVITQLLFEVPPCLRTAASAARAALPRSDVDLRIKSPLLCSIYLLYFYYAVPSRAAMCRIVRRATRATAVRWRPLTGLYRDSRANMGDGRSAQGAGTVRNGRASVAPKSGAFPPARNVPKIVAIK